MANSTSPTQPAAAARRDNSRLFWIVFFGALAAHVVMEIFEGVLDYLT